MTDGFAAFDTHIQAGMEPFTPPAPTANGGLKMERYPDDRWARPDLNRRPPGYQPGAPAKLSYGPLGGGR